MNLSGYILSIVDEFVGRYPFMARCEQPAEPLTFHIG